MTGKKTERINLRASKAFRELLDEAKLLSGAASYSEVVRRAVMLLLETLRVSPEPKADHAAEEGGWFFDLKSSGYDSTVTLDGRPVSGVYRVEVVASVDEQTTAKVFVHTHRTNIRIDGELVEVVEKES